MQRRRAAEVMGRRLPKPRPTFGIAWLILVYALGPALFIGGALDLAAQHVFGVCTGLWCAPPQP